MTYDTYTVGQKSDMAPIHYPKPEVVLSQPLIEVSHRNLICK